MRAKFDLTLYVAEPAAGLSLRLVYNAGLLSSPRAAKSCCASTSFCSRQMAAEPDLPGGRGDAGDAGGSDVLPDPLAPLDGAWHGGVHELFFLQAERAPEAAAVVDARASAPMRSSRRAAAASPVRWRRAG